MAGPTGVVAATWSGDCEALTSFTIDTDATVRPLFAGRSAMVAGWDGGRIIAEGTPEQVALVEESYTGQFLAPLLARERARRGA